MKNLFEKGVSSGNIDRVTNRLYNLMLFSIGALVFSNIFWVVWQWQVSKDADQKVYVRSGKSLFSANLESSSDSRNIYQARGLIEAFTELLFENNAENYRERLNTALTLITAKDGQAIVRGFNAEKVLENHFKYNSFSRLQVDSISINMNIIPYQCTVLMQQIIVYDGKEVANPIGAKFNLIPALYSDENPFGMLITNFNYITYQAIEKP
ncbi:hypothetical protein [Emticicia sp. W12TSBA100-4]|uniref:hypothetical protein n=1 Tax=Emticicia sp. W12TSBA100-4 TaxID=3160965 RepID=UPI0033063F0A